MNNITVLKTIDSVLGRALAVMLPAVRKKPHRCLKSPQSALIIRPGGIGDAVLLIPAIEELKKKYPDLKTDILCEKRNSGIFTIYTGVNKLYLYDKATDLLNCFKNSYDIIIDTEQWHRLSALLSYFMKAAIKVGFNTNERGKFFTHKTDYSHDTYEADSFLSLITTITGKDYKFTTDVPFLNSPAHPESHLYGNYVCIFPGATVKERRWGGHNYAKTAKTIMDMGFNVVILGGKSDTADADIIMQQCTGAVNYCARTTLKETAMLLKGSRALITADSGLLHLAAALGVPTVSLFGSGIEKKWGPKGKIHAILNRNLPCSPCTKFGYTPACKFAQKCIREITVNDVLDQLRLITTAS
ncbi:MAG: glycosyltransferase family 9 protein [Nitrospirae bacterium]|nr:glycosyltransferase family 9 protein [Nitrospirota bacterium]MBF0535493.1 glycosyltransferase family 9 protein [Nitrospirota bacterium]MBF0617375.1 glycosyltransferase family 9 protein [Nitrospirota bacterium]